MPIQLKEPKRDYERIRHTPKEKIQLAAKGYQHVTSSNVSAISTSGKDLLVRFHGGATYAYSNKAELYDDMLQSNSKGKFVWRRLIRPKVPYRRVNGVSLQTDEQFTDRDIMEAADVLRTKKKFKVQTLGIKDLANLGIIATDNVVRNILVTNTIS